MNNEKAFLKKQYPVIVFNNRRVKFDPMKHQLEQGEAAFYLDIDTGEIKKGIIEDVQLSRPMKYPVYTINNKGVVYHRAWPNVEGQKILDRINKEKLLLLNPKEREMLGIAV